MTATNKQMIKLKEYLDTEDYNDINKLQQICEGYDKACLKLEIDYKVAKSKEKSGVIGGINEFMYYYDGALVGYIGICYFGGDALEVNGMIHPEYRRRGLFKKLYSYINEEFQRRDVNKMLLLSDADSVSGQEFIKSLSAEHEHSEYEMFLNKNKLSLEQECRTTLRKASNHDAKEIARQNSIYFGVEMDEVNEILPEEEEKCGMEIFIAELNKKVIGKIHLETSNGIGAIYGLGVLPEYRGMGLGREILKQGVGVLIDKKMENVKLQVAVKNENALGLYKSCGFEVTSKMDYYQILK